MKGIGPMLEASEEAEMAEFYDKFGEGRLLE